MNCLFFQHKNLTKYLFHLQTDLENRLQCTKTAALKATPEYYLFKKFKVRC